MPDPDEPHYTGGGPHEWCDLCKKRTARLFLVERHKQQRPWKNGHTVPMPPTDKPGTEVTYNRTTISWQFAGIEKSDYVFVYPRPPTPPQDYGASC